MRNKPDREKFRFFPEAGNGREKLSPVPPEPEGKYPCPCCGSLTLPVPQEEAIAYICPVCFWENDVFVSGEDEPSDENHGMTLRQGREFYRKYGTLRPDRREK
ncbi:CPCC family cysteine-rich protein [uncultured Neglectibacter sp.]|uniref:CPCC family cysteine-rich protein n=1 Tax=uncultured Neglectibacter sp. TaxID=1924108 RepID=UPI0034E0032D